MSSESGSVEVVRLGPDDPAGLAELNRLFAEAFDDPENYGAAPPSDAWLRDWLASPIHVALVARSDGAQMVGGLVAYELTKFEQSRREFYIYDLAVAEPWRRRGVATALIDRLRAIARERQGWVVYVQADHGDDPAIALYTKLGHREDVMHFDILP